MNWRRIVYFEIFVLFLIDLFSKYFFEGKKFLENNFIYIHSSHNYGSSFSMFSNVEFYNYLIIILSIVFLIFLVWEKNYFFENQFGIIPFVFMFSGISGNLFDRLIFGYVRDFIGFFGLFIFNIADLYLTLAVICFLIYEMKNGNKNLDMK